MAEEVASPGSACFPKSPVAELQVPSRDGAMPEMACFDARIQWPGLGLAALWRRTCTVSQRLLIPHTADGARGLDTCVNLRFQKDNPSL